MHRKDRDGRMAGREITRPFRKWPLLAVLLLLLVMGRAQGTQCLITVNTSESDQYNPAISGDRIVWEDWSDGPSIHIYDIATGAETRVAPSPFQQFHPAISGPIVAWEELNEWSTLNVTYRNVLSGISGHLTTNGASPTTDGQRILWAEGSPPGALSLYDDATGSIITLATSDDTSVEHPALGGDRIAWVNGSETTIYLKNLSTGEELLITPGLNQVMHPVLSGDSILWQDYRSYNWDLYLFNLTSGNETQITAGPGDNQNPSIDGTKLVWVNGTEIYYNDTAGSDPPAAVSSGGLMNDMPKISGDRVVWQKFEDNGYYNIYLQTLGSSVPCPVAGFTTDVTSGIAPLTVQFTDTSSGSPGSWLWDFGDGDTTNATKQNPVHTYDADGTYSVSLTVGNSVGRDYTTGTDPIRVALIPIVSFTANQTYGIAPLHVQFTDTSSGDPFSRIWDFGDGSPSLNQSQVVHTYATPGTYTVTLSATNVNGTGTGGMPGPVRVLNGVNLRSTTDIGGLQVTGAGGVQEITLDTTQMVGDTFDPGSPASFSFTPPPSSGWQNITFFSSDGIGFAKDTGGIIRGSLSACTLESLVITPTMFTTDAGNNLLLSYRLELGAYPVLAGVNATVWEGVMPADDLAFKQILATKSAQFVSVLDTAYTLDFVSTNLTGVQGATLNLSVNKAWVTKYGNENNVTTIRMGSDGIDEVLNPTATFTDSTGNIEYYSIASPHGLSRFALVSAAGSSNLIQMGARIVEQVIQSSGTGGTGHSSNDYPATQPAQPPVVRQPATYYGEGEIDTTPAGITRDPVIIKSADRGMSLSIEAGTETFDSMHQPLTRLAASAPGDGWIPPLQEGTGFRFTGIVYDIRPDGATFNPPATLSFTVPDNQWDGNTQYSIRSYSTTTGSWDGIPTTVDPGTRTVSGKVSHLCLFGLFAVPAAGPATPAPTLRAPVATLQVQPKPIPQTPMGIFTGMMGWIYATATAHIPVSFTIILLGLGAIYTSTRRAWLARNRTWITLYLISLTGLLWALFLSASGGPLWESAWILITVIGLNLIVHILRFDRINLSSRAYRGYVEIGHR
jgi:beta propeller repeat protein